MGNVFHYLSGSNAELRRNYRDLQIKCAAQERELNDLYRLYKKVTVELNDRVEKYNNLNELYEKQEEQMKILNSVINTINVQMS